MVRHSSERVFNMRTCVCTLYMRKILRLPNYVFCTSYRVRQIVHNKSNDTTGRNKVSIHASDSSVAAWLSLTGALHGCAYDGTIQEKDTRR